PFLERGFSTAGEFGTGTPLTDPRFHPAVALYETGYEPGDGIGAARYMLRGTVRGAPPPHVLVTQVFRDEAVPNQSSEPLGAMLPLELVTLSIGTPGLRFATMTTTPAPYAPASGPTQAFVQYAPATHSLPKLTHVEFDYEMNFPPFTPLATPMPILNPVPQVHRQMERFLVDYFAGVPPTVIDPFQ